MAKRTKLSAVIGAGHHHYTGTYEAATVEDVQNIRVEVPELAWLHSVEIDFDAKTGTVKVRVQSNDENAANLPTLTVTDNTSFTVAS